MMMNRNISRILLAILILRLGSVPLSAQEVEERHVMVLYFVPLAGASASYAALFADTVAIELERLGYLVMPSSEARETFRGDPLDDAAVNQAALALGMDVAVTGFYVIDGTQIRIGVKAIDVAAGGAVAVAASESGPAGIDVFDTIDAISARIAKRVRESLKPIPKAAVTVEREEVRVETTVVEEIVELGTPVTVRLSSKDEGAIVSIVGTEIGAVAEGGIDLPGKDGEDLVVTIRMDGYHDRKMVIPVRAAKPTARAGRLLRISNQELAFRTSPDRPLGLDAAARFWPFPELLSWEAGAGLYYIPARYPDFATLGIAPSSVDSGYGLLELPLEAAARFFPVSLFDRGKDLSPYIELNLSETIVLHPGNLLSGGSLGALYTRVGFGLGLRFRMGTWDLSADAQILSPRFLGLGTLSGTRQVPGLRLRLEVALPW